MKTLGSQKRIRYAHHPRCILAYTGMLLRLSGVLMLTPLLVLISRPEEASHIGGFLIPALSLIVLGTILRKYIGIAEPSAMTLQEGSVVVVLSWGIVSLVSALPFMMVEGLNFTQAMFEAVSGWTTTGLSVVDVTTSTRMILMWRSVMQLAGGAGLAIIMLASIAGPTGTGLSAAEGRRQQLAPHIRTSVRLVMSIYSAYAIVGIIAYRIASLPLFEAINHAFTAVATGGFSTHPDGIAHYDSPLIEAITIPLMLLGSLNFLTAYALVRGKFKAVLRNGEIRLCALLIPICALILFSSVCLSLYSTVPGAVRVAVFEPTSALTGTGFTITSYENWSGLGLLIIITLMVIGGGTGSTAGGIKQYRIYLLATSIWWRVRRALLPRTAVVEHAVWRGESRDYITDTQISEIATFAFLYIGVWVLGSGIIAAHGYTLEQSLFEFASALGTVGLSLGVTAPNAPPLVLWTETLGMFLGRLEFFVVIVGLQKVVRDTIAILRPRR